MTEPPPTDASLFTVAAMEEMEKAQKEAPSKKREKKAPEEPKDPNEKMRQKMMAQMLKPPPVSIVKENIRQQEKSKLESEEAEKASLVNKINLYYERFPLLMGKLPKLSPRASLSETQQFLKMVYDVIDSVGSVHTIYGYVDTGLAKLESFMSDPHNVAKLPNCLQLNLKGMVSLFRQGKFPELDPIIAQLDIEYPWLGRRGLWMRTLSAIQGIAYKVHVFNTDPAMKKIMEMGKVPPIHLQMDPE